MQGIKKAVKILNALFISLLLFLFYLFILPIGKLLYAFGKSGGKKKENSYWINEQDKPVDLSSPY